MNKIYLICIGIFSWMSSLACYAADKFDILPDLPEPIVSSAAQASSVSTTDSTAALATQTVGQEPNFVSILFSLVFVIVLIYATGVVYTKLNKLGFNTLKRQMGDGASSHVSVVSTTALGGNKSLHVVELDGKRMLIGASVNSIHLIKDLGSYPPCEIEEGQFSKIEIPNIRIPKIEIPRIEIPGFTKVVSKEIKENDKDDKVTESVSEENNDNFEISDIYIEESDNPDGIIDKLFSNSTNEIESNEKIENVHKVDPEEFVLYKKYLN